MPRGRRLSRAHPRWRGRTGLPARPRYLARLMPGVVVLGAALAGAVMAGNGAWIHLKAQAAQYLIERAWHGGAHAGRTIDPWPWADTHVVARMRVPSLGIQRYVLAGAHGQALAFGPGHLDGTPPPGEPGNSVVAGHRDTHFEFLRDLAVGEAIFFDLPDGRTVRYRVRRMRVTSDTDLSALAQGAETRLTLITCFPFDALRAGGSLRYIVEAYG